MTLRPASSGALIAALLLVLVGCGENGDPTTATESTASPSASSSGSPSESSGTRCAYVVGGPAAKEVSPPPVEATASGEVAVTIRTDRGDLPVTLDAEATPCTVSSFVSLAEQGYFDDTPCHRLTTDGFYIVQCGDPTGTGTGGPGYSYADELTGTERYPAGTLAMANAGPDTNGSQFFIVYDDTQLGPQYTVFGTVAPEGLDVIRTVAEAGTDESNGPGDGHPNTSLTITGVTPD